MNTELTLNPNRLVAALGKPSKDFTKADIVKYITENGIRMVNFMYPAGDGRLKTLNFVINNAAYLDAILTCGERVDGSSLFPFIEAGSSDLARKLGLVTDGNRIVTNEKMETNVPGLFAAGDCTGGLLQVAKAVSDGATAGLEALKYLRGQK